MRNVSIVNEAAMRGECFLGLFPPAFTVMGV